MISFFPKSLRKQIWCNLLPNTICLQNLRPSQRTQAYHFQNLAPPTHFAHTIQNSVSRNSSVFLSGCYCDALQMKQCRFCSWADAMWTTAWEGRRPVVGRRSGVAARMDEGVQLQPSSRLETADIRSRPLRESCSGNVLLSLVASCESDASVSWCSFEISREPSSRRCQDQFC